MALVASPPRWAAWVCSCSSQPAPYPHPHPRPLPHAHTHPHPHLHCLYAGISTNPAISSATGDTSGAQLRVMRPGTMADDAVATYLIQAFSNEEGTTKVGRTCTVQQMHMVVGGRCCCCAYCRVAAGWRMSDMHLSC